MAGKSAPTTSSPSSRVMPLTPYAVRPIERTSLSGKRMLMPCAVERRMSLVPSVIMTLTSSSPSSIPSAMMPAVRTLLKAVRSVFFTTPRLVTKNTNLFSSNSRVTRTCASFSSWAICTRLMMALPRAVRLAAGISWTLSQ